MRETRLSGSEGGGALLGSPYPYHLRYKARAWRYPLAYASGSATKVALPPRLRVGLVCV